MFLNYFNCLREHGVPVTIREQMDLLAALDRNIVFADTQDFYYLSRTVLVKDEKYFDRFEDADDMRMEVSPTAEIGMYEGQITGRDRIHHEGEIVNFFELLGLYERETALNFEDN